ncbi:MAG: hypothetical protein IKI23_04670 [Lachnospiraceae bacterium]|nr:hypothetical protein [Lachnospiraceae bacterium]
MTKFTKFMSLAMALTLEFAMTACGCSKAPEKETAEAEEAQTEETQAEEAEQTEEAPEAETGEAVVTDLEYNIAANLTDTMNEDGSRTIETDYFTVTLPLGDTWEYEVNDAYSISIYNTAAKNNDCGGHLGTIVAVDPADTDYQNLPHYAEIGQMGGILYIIDYPTDVQADVTNDKNREDYQTVFAELGKIETEPENMPVILK